MKKLDIIYEDKELLVVNKPSKLLSISDGKTMNTLYSMAYDYVKKKHKSNKIFIVHRLDKDTSGVIVFAKNEKMKKYLQDHWNLISKREYLAIVEGVIKENQGVIKEYLLEDKTHRVYASKNKKGEYAETYYKVLNRFKNYTVLQVEIKTGKKNQIRVGLSDIGHPIIGDKKYGSLVNPIGRLGLHANKIVLKFQDKEYEFVAKKPKEFVKFIK